MKGFIAWTRSHQASLSAAIIVLSAILLTAYLVVHPSIISTVARVNIVTLIEILVLDTAILGMVFTVTHLSIRLCGKNLPARDSLMLTVYSTLINFFGPLQSGPGVRAIYLKQKIGLRVRDYTAAMLFYYFAYSAISASLLAANLVPVLSVVGVIFVGALCIAGARRFKFDARLVFAIYIVALVQTMLFSSEYFIELHSIGAPQSYSYLQALVYTGSANLSLLVSITPAGVGVREAFIIFAQSLHHIPLASIVATGVLDRVVYVAYLVIIFVAASGMHFKQLYKIISSGSF